MSTLETLMVRCHSNPVPLTAWEAEFVADLTKRTCTPSPKQIEVLARIADRVDLREVVDCLTARTEELAEKLVGNPPSYIGRNEIRFGSKGGLTNEPDAPIRFHPACPRGADRLPAMIALMTDPVTNEPVGIHRTYLRADGNGKADVTPAKMMLGGAGIIRLVPDEHVMAGLGIAEGIETALSVMQGFGWRPVWAAASAGGIASFPTLAGIASLTIFADADPTGAKAADACAASWADAGREVRIMAPPAGDFDDLAREIAA